MSQFEFAPWTFIVDTDSYAGNFEKYLCAYCTGCSEFHGEEYAEMFRQDFNLIDEYDGGIFEPILTRPSICSDDSPTQEPCSIWPTPGWFNNGMGGHFRESDENAENDAKEELSKSWLEYGNQHKSEEYIKRAEEVKLAPLIKYPAYMSVAIFFSEKPSDELIGILIERSNKFCEIYNKIKNSYPYITHNDINIENFRLIHTELIETEVPIQLVFGKDC